MSAPIDLDAVERAVAAMTDGKWFVEKNPRHDGATGVMVIVNRGSSTSSHRAAIAYRQEDAAGIVSIRNAAPQMIAELRELRELRDRLSKANQFGIEARDALTAWLDAPRMEARKTPTVVAERDGIRLLTTSSGEWGVADDESPSWLSCEAEARYEFRDATGTVSCESCARFIDRDDAHVDADGIYGCADEDACSAAIAAKESL